MNKLLIPLAAIAVAGFSAPASAATLSRSVELKAPAAQVWAKVGAFCAISDWHPALASCALDGKSPPTRTLATKDGKATFVELQTAHTDHSYSYTFVSSPVPVKNYVSTFRIAPKGKGASVVTWSSHYTPVAGQEKAAKDALAGIYDSGLQALKQSY